jgi:cytochrome c oxidase subunit II
MGRKLQQLIGVATLALAGQAGANVPESKALGFQPPATELAERAQSFHNYYLMPMAVGVTVLVLVLLLIVIVKFNAKANPVPSKTTHNTFIEVIWTVLPIIILIVLAVPSFKLLYAQSRIPTPDVVIKATGHQWNWSYEYVDSKFEFTSAIMPEAEARAKNLPWLLETDNRIVVPVGKVIKMQVTAADVIHAWNVPAFFVQMDAVPGRLNETWFKVTKPGIYYGQCFQICGMNHAYMPITVEVVSPAQYAAWLETAKTKFATNGKPAHYALADTASTHQ